MAATYRLTAEQRRLVENNVHLARAYLKKSLGKRYARVIGRDDALSTAYVGLCRAAAKYDPSRGPFVTYAWIWMRGALARACISPGVALMQDENYRTRDGRVGYGSILSLDFDARDADDGLESQAVQDYRHPNPADAAAARLDAAAAMRLLTARERVVVAARADGMSYSEIGRALGVSDSRVQQLYDRAVARVRAGRRPVRSQDGRMAA